MFGFLTYISDFLPKLWALRLIYAIFLMFSPLLAFLLLFFVCKQCFGKRSRSEKGGEGKLYYILISPSRSEYHSAESRISHCRNTPAARRIQQKARQGAPAIKQVAHGRCLGRRYGRLILPCRFSVFVCCVCTFAHFCAACYRYDTFAHADADFRVSAFLCFCGIRYPFTRMFALAVSPT